MDKIKVKSVGVSVLLKNGDEFISLTDIAKYKDKKHPADLIKNWLRSKSSIEFLGFWETINNPDFKLVEFDQFKKEAGSNAFILTPSKWAKETKAIGILSRPGRYRGGTFAHKDIAFEFASWISSEFKLYLIKEFQRLKEQEAQKQSLDWNLSRTLAKINYRIHTDSIKENLIPKVITTRQKIIIYANEADILNVALFGMTAKEWRSKNKGKTGNIRDYAEIIQLICLSNLESINAELIREGLSQSRRLVRLNRIAITQMNSLVRQGKRNLLN